MSFDLKTQIQAPIIIIGLARSGVAAQHLLLESGFTDDQIITYDEHRPEAMIKTEQELERLSNVKTAVVSPGVPLTKLFIQRWREQGVVITSEINLALSQITDEKLIGITGSLGKSTITSLIGAGIHTFDRLAFVGGNLGIPLCEYALTIKKDPELKAKWIVLELSSYQLENAQLLALDYSLISFLSPNHLERYKDLKDYYETKWAIVGRTKNSVILNRNGGDLYSFVSAKPSKKIKWSNENPAAIKSLGLDQAQLIGKHNQENLVMASMLGKECSFPESYFQGLKAFKGLKHRLETLGFKKNIAFINDSKATTIDSVRAAVLATKESFPNLPIYLLLGGRDKMLPWPDLKSLTSDPLLHLFFFGEFGSSIKKILASSGADFKTLKLLLAHLATDVFTNPSESEKKDLRAVVLFSPGGVSQDEFSSFEERGDYFRFWFTRLG